MALAVFGDLSPEKARAMMEFRLRLVPVGPRPALACAKAAPKLPARREQTQPKEQAILLAGFPGVDLKDPRCDTLAALQTALSGLSSSLSDEVRERRGLAYFVGAYHHVGVEPGAFVFYAGTKPEAVAEVESLVRKEYRRLAEAGLTKEELDRARNQIIADADAALQNNSGMAMSCALDELLGLGYAHAFTTRRRFEAITVEDTRRAAAALFRDDKLAVSVLLPEKAAPAAGPEPGKSKP
jgi:predicted Zn-dependent peptidase